MLPFMQDQNTEDVAPERDLREELLEAAQKKFQSGDFRSARTWLDETIDAAVEETAVLRPIRANLRLDPGAVVVAGVCTLALLVIAGLTLFH
jgi:hypothetical protein